MSEKQFRVLVAENAPGEAATALRAVFPEPDSKLELSLVSSIPTLLAALALDAPEAIFLDLALGRPDPLAGVRRVHRAAPEIPLIVCADAADKSSATRSLSEGAIDYVLKGYMDSRTIERALRTALERNTLEGLADLLRDEFTGLYNREGFMTLGARAMETAIRTGGTLVLLCAQIANLELLRSQFGSAGCEEALEELTAILKQCFRRTDVLARLGSAQFCALAVDAAEPSAPVLRQRVESRLAVINQSRQPWGPLELGVSVGCWGPDNSESFGEFLDQVESQLRRSNVALPQATGQPESTALQQHGRDA